MRVTEGKGKKRTLFLRLSFSVPLDPVSAGTTSHYQVTQSVSKKKMRRVPVLAALYGAANNASSGVTAKPMQPSK